MARYLLPMTADQLEAAARHAALHAARQFGHEGVALTPLPHTDGDSYAYLWADEIGGADEVLVGVDLATGTTWDAQHQEHPDR